MSLLAEIAAGRSDAVFEYLADGGSADTVHEGLALVGHCAYYGDVSALKYLLSRGASLAPLGENLGLNGASFHGHWRLCKFLLEQGANVNHLEADTRETALHSALCTPNRLTHNLVLRVLVAAGANPNIANRAGAETGCFMRDCRTKGETPLHRAAAFGDEEAIQILLDAGAKLRCQRRSWRLASILGQLVRPPRTNSQLALLRQLPRPLRSQIHAGLCPRRTRRLVERSFRGPVTPETGQ